MLKIINGKRYNTDTAELAEITLLCGGTFHFFSGLTLI